MCPAAHLPVAAGARHVDTSRYLLNVLPGQAILLRLDFAPEEAADVLAEARAEADGRGITVSTERADLADAFRALAFEDPAPPLGATCTAMVLEREPPRVDGVEIRRVDGIDGFRAGLAIEDAVFGGDRSADAQELWERRRVRPGGEWLAYLDGRPVAYAGAVAGPLGLYLSSGATLPEARGRGLYRALVRARWDEAVRLGTPALAVHAQAPSRPILARLGFEEVATVHELELAA